MGLLALSLALAPSGVRAQSLFERLVMPGPLTEAHAKLEKECSNCHESFSQGAQGSLCLDCHETTAADVEAGSGYHGRSSEARGFECSHCHTDHEGRDFEIVEFSKETFNHNLTDFALVGAHSAAACSSCHEEAKTFREAPSDCATCHEADEPHDRKLGTVCSDCHTETAWSEIRPFDHAKTGFALKEGHADVPCMTCHQAQVWEGLPTDCVGCHAIQDVHANRFGPKCESCHSESGWEKVRFEHDRDTKFALTGAHVEASCKSCHGGNVETEKPGTACRDCHAADDPHAGELGADCAQCHNTKDWPADVAFDHDLTSFPLAGIHATVICEQCHVSATFHKVDTDCASCHAADDTHKASLGTDCATCHTPNGWAYWIFDHGAQTDFTLTGQHDGLVCSSCHKEGTRPDAVPTACVECHERDDVHRGTFGPACDACHDTNSFKGARLR